jgi:hypothetical protein
MNIFLNIFYFLPFICYWTTNSIIIINMGNFVQAIEYDVYMYAKFEWLDAYRFL